MIKAQFIEVIPNADGLPPKEVELGYTMLAEPLMERKVPEPNSTGRMPPPVMVKIKDVQFFVIGFTYTMNYLGTKDEPSESVYVVVVQRVPTMGKSGLVKANAGAMDQIKALIPAPGGNRKQ